MPILETYRTVVAPADCDVLGHMNVSRYFQACSEGMFSLQTRLALGISDLRGGRRLSFAVVHAESDFVSEVQAGEVIFMKSGIERLGSRSGTFHHWLYKSESDTLAFETLFTCVLFDLQARRAREIPGDVRRLAAAFMIENEETQ